MDRPAFQFYVKDWKTNLKLRRCSEAARGAWIEILCLLHCSPEYGVARFPLVELAAAAGVTMRSANELVRREVLKGGDENVPEMTHTPTHGGRVFPPEILLEKSASAMWYSSRMVVDEWARRRKGASTRFDSEKNQPSRQPTRRHGERQGESPSRVPSRIPTRVETARLGYGSAVAVALNPIGSVVDNTTEKPIPDQQNPGERPARYQPPPGGILPSEFMRQATGKPPRPPNGSSDPAHHAASLADLPDDPEPSPIEPDIAPRGTQSA